MYLSKKKIKTSQEKKWNVGTIEKQFENIVINQKVVGTVLELIGKIKIWGFKKNNFGVCVLFKGCLEAKTKLYMSQERQSKGHMLKGKPKTSCLWKKFSKKQSYIDQTEGEYMKYFDKPIETTNPDRQTDSGYEHEIHRRE